MSANLTDEQLLVADSRTGHTMVTAVPGSGKTTTMSHFVRGNLDDGLSPKHLLVLMFNRSTREDFKGKLKSLGVTEAGDKRFPVFTYHGMAYRLCDYFVKKGLMESFYLETSDFKLKLAASQALMKAYPKSEYNRRKKDLIDSLTSFIDYHKSVFLSEQESFRALGFKEKDRALLQAFSIFESTRKSKGIYYFTDLLRESVNTLMNNDAARNLVADKKELIVVDEFQDTNPVQYEMLRNLAGNRARMVVVGDIDQTIYEWCGADPEFMRHQFSRDFPDVQMYPMSYTFRYGPALSEVSTNLIQNNRNRFDQRCESFNQDQSMNLNAHGISSDYEPALVYDLISSSTSEDAEDRLDYKDIAVISRVYGAAGGIEMELLKNGVPCLIPKESSILQSREMKAIMSIARLVTCFELSDDPWTLIDMHYGADLNELTCNTKMNFLGGDVREQLIHDYLTKNPNDICFHQYISSHPQCQELMAQKPYTKRIIDDEPLKIEMALRRSSRRKDKTLDQKLQAIFRRLEIKDHLKGKAMTPIDEDVSERRVDAIIGYIRYHDLDGEDFIDNINQLREQQENTRDVEDGILITSVHKAKGLEWPTVIMPTLEEGIFPFEPEEGMTSDLLEAERRLFYVAMTRAKSTLHLIGPSKDGQYRKLLETGHSPANAPGSGSASSFLFELGISDQSFHLHHHREYGVKGLSSQKEHESLSNSANREDSRTLDTGGL